MSFRKYFLFFGLIHLMYSSSNAQAVLTNDQLITKLNKALQTKDTTGLSSILAPNFSIAGHTGPGANFRLYQIIKNYEGVAAKIISSEKTAKGICHAIEIVDDKKVANRSQVLVNAEGKIVYATQFDILYGLQRNPTSNLIAQIPFENNQGSIILKVQVNNSQKPLRLLFDTGADGIAINQSLADQLALTVNREKDASVVGGDTRIKLSAHNFIQIGDLKLQDIEIAIFPALAGENVDGILGNVLIRKFITEIDYDNNVLNLYAFGKHAYKGKGKIVPVTMPSGVVHIPGELEIVHGKRSKGQFVFDTGASYDLICFRPFVRTNKLLVSGFKPEIQASTVSMGFASPTFLGKAYRFLIDGLDYIDDFPVTLMGASPNNETWNPGVDGSIGVRLLSRYNLTINLAENEMFFVPNKLSTCPKDFTLKDYQFGWNNKSELVLLASKTSEEYNTKLNVGTVIKGIHIYPVDKLQSKPQLIAEVQQNALSGKTINVTLQDGSIIEL